MIGSWVWEDSPTAVPRSEGVRNMSRKACLRAMTASPVNAPRSDQHRIRSALASTKSSFRYAAQFFAALWVLGCTPNEERPEVPGSPGISARVVARLDSPLTYFSDPQLVPSTRTGLPTLVAQRCLLDSSDSRLSIRERVICLLEADGSGNTQCELPSLGSYIQLIAALRHELGMVLFYSRNSALHIAIADGLSIRECRIRWPEAETDPPVLAPIAKLLPSGIFYGAHAISIESGQPSLVSQLFRVSIRGEEAYLEPIDIGISDYGPCRIEDIGCSANGHFVVLARRYLSGVGKPSKHLLAIAMSLNATAQAQPTIIPMTGMLSTWITLDAGALGEPKSSQLARARLCVAGSHCIAIWLEETGQTVSLNAGTWILGAADLLAKRQLATAESGQPPLHPTVSCAMEGRFCVAWMQPVGTSRYRPTFLAINPLSLDYYSPITPINVDASIQRSSATAMSLYIDGGVLSATWTNNSDHSSEIWLATFPEEELVRDQW